MSALNLLLGKAQPPGVRLAGGYYKVVVASVEDKSSTKGEPMVVFTVKPLDPREGLGSARLNLMVPTANTPANNLDLYLGNWILALMSLSNISDVAVAQQKFAQISLDTSSLVGQTGYIHVESDARTVTASDGSTKVYDEVRWITAKDYNEAKAGTNAGAAQIQGFQTAPTAAPQQAAPQQANPFGGQPQQANPFGGQPQQANPFAPQGGANPFGG